MSVYVHISDPALVLSIDGVSQSDVVDWFAEAIRKRDAIEVAIPGGAQLIRRVVNLGRVAWVDVSDEKPGASVQVIAFQVPGKWRSRDW